MSIQARFKCLVGGFALDVDLNVPAQGVTAVYGPSGCGKTTLLRAIAGLDRHEGGVLKVGAVVWQDEGCFVPTHKRALGYVFQEASLFPHLDVRGNLEYGLKRLPGGAGRVSLDAAVELLGLGALLERKPYGLSGGERQRVAIARALASSPRLLLMDEPLAGLDRERKLEILPYIESLHRALDIPVVYVSHSTDEVARVADHLVVMDGGRVSGSGDIHTMLTRVDLPLAHGPEAESLIDADVTGFDEAFHLTKLSTSAGAFYVVHQKLAVGSKVRLRIAARDVSLTLAKQEGTSILNIVPVRIDEIIPEGEAQVTVRLLARDVPLLARITRKSAEELKLARGKKMFAQIKSVALLA